MYTFLLILLILDAILLVVAILLQAAKGGGMAASFGGATTAADAFIGARQASNWLSRFSWYGGGAFLFLAFILQLMSARPSTPRSVLDQPLTQTPAPATPAPAPKAGTTIPLTPAQPAEKNPTPEQQPKKP
jgi:preprotein translocase subunit SecG